MALPLLMLAGAGILGGGRFLLERQEAQLRTQQAEQAQGYLEQYLQGPGAALAQADPQAGAAAAVQLAADPGNLTAILSGLENRRTAIPGQLSQQQAANMAQTVEATNRLQTDYTKGLGDLAATQDAYKRGLAAFEGGTQSDAIAALYSFFQTIEPGGRITESEQGQFEGHGGISNQIAGMLNSIRGQGLTAKTRQEFSETLGRLYAPRYQRGRQQLRAFEQRIQNRIDQGLNVNRSDVIGGLGIDFDFGPQQQRIGGPPPPPALGNDGLPALPPGFTRTDPNARRRRSVREQRGR